MTYNGRRDCLEETLASLGAHECSGLVTRGVLVDDSGEGELFPPPGFILITHGANLGMARTVQDAWNAALVPGIEFVLHWEDDMRLDRPLPLAAAVYTLRQHPRLAQMCFQRHPVNGEEHAHGGQLAARLAKTDGRRDLFATHTVHGDVFSLNPCLIPRRVCELGWPEGPIGVGNEDGFTAKCKDAGLEFATWGTVESEPYVTHIGHERASAWKL